MMIEFLEDSRGWTCRLCRAWVSADDYAHNCQGESSGLRNTPVSPALPPDYVRLSIALERIAAALEKLTNA